MHLTRKPAPATGTIAVGVTHPDGSWRSLDRDLDVLLRERLDDIRALAVAATERAIDIDRDLPATAATATCPLPPVAGRMEVWAAGVTYERSRDAREEESQVADVYGKVYDAERPELFFKALPWKVVAEGAPVGIRADSALNVPEPEVALLVNAHAEIVGYTVCNDVSSRSIEGENPLYLPQAKVYWHACAVASAVRVAWDVREPRDLAIHAEIRRDGGVVWAADGNTSRMRRRFAELVDWAFRGDVYPDGILLSTGTMLVPEMDVTLQAGDEVEISVAGIGTLCNPVTVGVPRG